MIAKIIFIYSLAYLNGFLSHYVYRKIKRSQINKLILAWEKGYESGCRYETGKSDLVIKHNPYENLK